jgi:hypothetical protein
MIDQTRRTGRYGTIENYVATFDETERGELAVAKLALVVADALSRARHRHGPRAAALVPVAAGEIDPQLLLTYLHELGHDVKLIPISTPAGTRLKAIPRGRHFPRYRRPKVCRPMPAAS